MQMGKCKGNEQKKSKETVQKERWGVVGEVDLYLPLTRFTKREGIFEKNSFVRSKRSEDCGTHLAAKEDFKRRRTKEVRNYILNVSTKRKHIGKDEKGGGF